MPELLEAFRAGDGAELVRELVQPVRQQLIAAEATKKNALHPTNAPRSG